MQHRVPSFQRMQPEERLLAVLNAGAAVLAEHGYDAATMTEIAKRAGTSIGTVYHYFRDKPSIVLALRSRYGEAMEECLGALEAEADCMSVEQIAHRLVDIALDFARKHPAYFHVLDAPVKGKRNEADRARLRESIGRILQGKAPALSKQQAGSIARVVIQVTKGIGPLFVESRQVEQDALAEQYKLLIKAYLGQHFR